MQAQDAALGGQDNEEAAAAAAAAGDASDAAAAAAGSSQDQAAAEEEEEVQNSALQQLMHAYNPHHAEAFLTGEGHWQPEQQPTLQQRLAPEARAWEPALSKNLAGLQQGEHWQHTAPDASNATVQSGAAASGGQHAAQPGPEQCVGCRISLCWGGGEWHGATVEVSLAKNCLCVFCWSHQRLTRTLRHRRCSLTAPAACIQHVPAGF